MVVKMSKKLGPSEYEIQREAHTLLSEALGENYIVRGEYTHRGCRFDLAIFLAKTSELVCTIEIKRRRGNQNGKLKTRRQTTKYYRATNKPCILLTDKTMHSAIAALKKQLSYTSAISENGDGEADKVWRLYSRNEVEAFRQ